MPLPLQRSTISPLGEEKDNNYQKFWIFFSKGYYSH
ncbi:hypothetical protein SMU88_01165 [Streptococcus mutans NLML8]|nr:hypothetical protein SMU88_01165 [Streptococcus mutans NLML8]EMB77076.1 hypothetical protein SMU41_00660 [Streptococcus mutans 2VS1]EMC30002.1 hypothetical protein SMU85_00649 [Streptococcus mutans ST6]